MSNFSSEAPFDDDPLLVAVADTASSSEVDFNWSLRRADARPDLFPVISVDLAAAQVAHLSGRQGADARVADPLAAAVRQLQALLLAGDEDRRRSVADRLAVAVEELDQAALALLEVAGRELRLEALHVEVVEAAGFLVVVVDGVEHLARAREERLALLPIRAELLQMRGLEAAHLARVLLVQPEPVVLVAQLAQLLAEDHVVLFARRVDQHHVVHLIEVVKR